jgi:hypothetical protein
MNFCYGLKVILGAEGRMVLCCQGCLQPEWLATTRSGDCWCGELVCCIQLWRRRHWTTLAALIAVTDAFRDVCTSPVGTRGCYFCSFWLQFPKVEWCELTSTQFKDSAKKISGRDTGMNTTPPPPAPQKKSFKHGTPEWLPWFRLVTWLRRKTEAICNKVCHRFSPSFTSFSSVPSLWRIEKLNQPFENLLSRLS